jgi:hypothetical protein
MVHTSIYLKAVLKIDSPKLLGMALAIAEQISEQLVQLPLSFASNTANASRKGYTKSAFVENTQFYIKRNAY